VFGRERNGLENDEVGLADAILTLPVNPAFASLNLAQAVLLVGYELRLAALGGGGGVEAAAEGPGAAASAGELEAAVQDLRSGLLAIGYLDPACPDRVMSELRRLLARAHPTRREVTLLRGVARQVGWAGRYVAKSGPGGR